MTLMIIQLKSLLEITKQASLLYSLKEIRQIAFDVLHGLAFLNSHGIVHRNLSPQNVLIDLKVRN